MQHCTGWVGARVETSARALAGVWVFGCLGCSSTPLMPTYIRVLCSCLCVRVLELSTRIIVPTYTLWNCLCVRVISHGIVNSNHSSFQCSLSFSLSLSLSHVSHGGDKGGSWGAYSWGEHFVQHGRRPLLDPPIQRRLGGDGLLVLGHLVVPDALRHLRSTDPRGGIGCTLSSLQSHTSCAHRPVRP